MTIFLLALAFFKSPGEVHELARFYRERVTTILGQPTEIFSGGICVMIGCNTFFFVVGFAASNAAG